MHDSFENYLLQIFKEDNFTDATKVTVDDLETVLTVDKEHLDCEMSEEYLDKLLDVTKYQEN